jgi:hypothetical protein
MEALPFPWWRGSSPHQCAGDIAPARRERYFIPAVSRVWMMPGADGIVTAIRESIPACSGQLQPVLAGWSNGRESARKSLRRQIRKLCQVTVFNANKMQAGGLGQYRGGRMRRSMSDCFGSTVLVRTDRPDRLLSGAGSGPVIFTNFIKLSDYV